MGCVMKGNNVPGPHSGGMRVENGLCVSGSQGKDSSSPSYKEVL